MAYDIPPELAHKERILFGLTFEQLGYAAPAALLIFFLVLKSGLHYYWSISLSLLTAGITSLFMFFNGKKLITSFVRFLLFRRVRERSEELKRIVNVKEIKEGVIHTKSGNLAILEVTPINFLIRKEEEQKHILTSFQKFLNSLDFPVQVHISSFPLDIKEHFSSLKKALGKKSPPLQSYEAYINHQIEEHKTKNRRFYVIIKETYGLDVQTEVCLEKLSATGVQVKRLHDREILSFFYDYIAGFSTKETATTVNRADFLHFLLSPQTIQPSHDFYVIKNTYHKVLAVTGYPHTVEQGFLDKLISSSEDYDVSIHIEPHSIDQSMLQLNRELQKQQADLHADSKRGIMNPSLDIKLLATKKVLEDLQKGRQKMFHVSLYVLCRGKSKEDVERLAKKVQTTLAGQMIQCKTPLFQMLQGYESILPLAKDTLHIRRNIHTSGLSAFFPFSSPFLDIDSNGVLFGLNRNNIPYIKDIFSLTNANGLVLATSGAGKSYFTKLLLSRQHMAGCDVLIIDPQGEYAGITSHCGGEVITISKNSPSIINPLDLMGHNYIDKRLSLTDLFTLMFGSLSDVQKAILDRAVDMTYSKKGISKDGWKNRKPPLMEDLYKTLVQLEKKAVHQEKMTYRALLNRLGMYTSTGVFSFLNKQTTIDFSKRFVCFNIGDMPKQIKPVVMFLILDFIYTRMKSTSGKKLLVLDEAWSLLQGVEESSYVFEIVKTCRKYNLGMLMITQDVNDLLGSRAGAAVLSNTSYTFLLRQKSSVMGNVSSTFQLSPLEREYLVTAERGQGLLILENEHQEIKVIASDEEHQLITTNPNELSTHTAREDVRDCINLDLNQDVYLAKDLDVHQQNYLSANGYVLDSFHSLTRGRQEQYLVKKYEDESAYHTYYVDLLYNEIRKYTSSVEQYRTEKPDIIFRTKNGIEVAIEVETGMRSSFLSEKSYLKKKFDRLKKEYADRCLIFLPNAKKENSYKRYGLPILLRLQAREFLRSQLE